MIGLFHQLIQIWFHWVEVGGYLGVFILMAMESSIIPVPSEIVIPPAAFWAAQGRMDLIGVILAGTLGSYFGSLLNYLLFFRFGTPLVKRFGSWISPEQFAFAVDWVQEYGAKGVFVARLLPVLRHLISIPAGLFRMRLMPFSISTLVGAGVWCSVLGWLGQKVIGDQPELLQSPEAMIGMIKDKSLWFVAGVAAFSALYCVMYVAKAKMVRARQA